MNRVTGASVAWYISDRPVLDSEAGGPGNPAIAALTAVGQISGSISRTPWHEAQGVTDAQQSELTISYDNSPAGSAGGPLDDMQDQVLDRQVAEIYLDGTVVWRGEHQGEPQFTSGTDGQWTVTSVLAPPRGPSVRLLPWLGVTTGIKSITAITGRASVPSNTAYDVTEFTVFGAWKGDLRGNLIRRGPGVTNTQIRAFWNSVSGNITIVYRTPAGVQVVLYDDVEPEDAPYHWALVSISPDVAFAVIDGVVVGSVTSPAAPAVGTGFNISLGGNDSGHTSTTFAWGFLDRGLSKGEATALDLTTILDDAALVSLWRGDDGAGSTVVDSGPLGNDASISGTVNVDWEWAPADAGDPSQAGTLIPEVYGNQRLVPLPLIDHGRNRHAYARRANKTTTTLQVREGGVSISHTEDTNGVLDLTGSASKPVTVDRTGGFPTDRPSEALEDFLDQHWPITRASSFTEAFNTSLVGEAGFRVTAETEAAAVLQEALHGLGSWYEVARDGRLEASMLVPPAPSYLFNEYLQSGGTATAGPTMTAGTVTGWILPRVSRVVEIRLGSSKKIRVEPGTDDERAQGVLNLSYHDSEGSQGSFVGKIVVGSWLFFGVSIVARGGGGSDITLSYSQGGAITQKTFSSNQDPGFGGAAFPDFDGGRLASVADLQVYAGGTLSAAILTEIRDTGSSTGTPQWRSQLRLATWNGTRWTAPVQNGSGVVNLTTDPANINQPEADYEMERFPEGAVDVQRQRSLSSVLVAYDRGPGALSTSELGASVVASERAGLQLEWKTRPAGFEQAPGERLRELRVESVSRQAAAAAMVGRAVAAMSSGSVYMVRVTGIPREAMNLTPHAEVRVTETTGRVLRVRAVTRGTSNVLDPLASGFIVGPGVVE